MQCIDVRPAQKTFPTGNPNFSVQQAFPAAFTAEESDPFLMCDEIGPRVSVGAKEDPDDFPVGWHGHVGMDIATYVREGTGRHADSLGNRETYASPGLQWISVGSGIEHAEGGGTPAGERHHAFQIWVNTPAAHKAQPPRYGTSGPETIPTVNLGPGVSGRLLS